jgi:hypothetical protein
MKLLLIIVLACLSSWLVFFGSDRKPASVVTPYGKWEVIAQFAGGVMEFSEYQSFVVDKDSIAINAESESSLHYKSDEIQTSSDEFGMLAWYPEGSADGTPAGVPIMALRFKVKGETAILKIRIGNDPVRDFKFEQSEKMETIIFVLRMNKP